MRTKAALLMLFLSCGAFADNLEKTQKKELQAQAKAMMQEAASLQSAGKLAEARARYAESQAMIETNDAGDAIKHLDEEIHQRVKDILNRSRKLYDSQKFTEAAAALNDGLALGAYQVVLSYDLALCYYQLGDRTKALEYLLAVKAGTLEPKQRQKVLQMLSFFITGENGTAGDDKGRDQISQANLLAEGIGMEASLEDDGEAEEPIPELDPAPRPSAKTSVVVNPHSNANAGHSSSLCNALATLKASLVKSPSAYFNLANCAESNGRTAEAVRLLQTYLEISPTALDADQARTRISDLQLLQSVPAPSGAEIRRLYASVYSSLAERKYDRALSDLTHAGDVAPDFPLTQWKLGLLYEAMGNVAHARENFLRYQQLAPDQSRKDEANLHLTTLDAKRDKYDEEVDAAGDIISDLFNRALNLTFNQSESRSALRAKRARVKKKEQNKARNRVGGFAIPFAYAQLQLARASEHLQIALDLFPLGAEANELMGLVFLQANDGRSAIRCFDVVASQSLPVSFYAETRGHKQDQATKCEMTRDRLRLIFLSSYDKKGNPAPPDKPAGEDGLGDLIVEPSTPRQEGFDSLDLALGDIKKVETDKGILRLKLTHQEISLSPIYLPAFTPIEGPPARRFANNYTRLFVRYPGLEDSKLGAEGMTGGEKFKMGYDIASASVDMAMSGFTPISAISSVQDAITIARTIHSAMASLSVSFASWERSVGDQQQLLAGKSFKAIPTQPVSLVFVQDTK